MRSALLTLAFIYLVCAPKSFKTQTLSLFQGRVEKGAFLLRPMFCIHLRDKLDSVFIFLVPSIMVLKKEATYLLNQRGSLTWDSGRNWARNMTLLQLLLRQVFLGWCLYFLGTKFFACHTSLFIWMYKPQLWFNQAVHSSVTWVTFINQVSLWWLSLSDTGAAANSVNPDFQLACDQLILWFIVSVYWDNTYWRKPAKTVHYSTELFNR